MNFQSMLKSIFSFVWRKRLIDYKLVKVIGWRSCIIESKIGDRIRATFLFGKIEKRDGTEREETDTTDSFNFRARDLNDTSISGT